MAPDALKHNRAFVDRDLNKLKVVISKTVLVAEL
jgi:hypothetical protein